MPPSAESRITHCHWRWPGTLPDASHRGVAWTVRYSTAGVRLSRRKPSARTPLRRARGPSRRTVVPRTREPGSSRCARRPAGGRCPGPRPP
jgi:hypothetical protein